LYYNTLNSKTHLSQEQNLDDLRDENQKTQKQIREIEDKARNYKNEIDHYEKL